MINGVLGGCFIRVSVTDTVLLMASIWQAWQCWTHSSQSQSSLLSTASSSSGASTRQCSYSGGASGRCWEKPLCIGCLGGAAEAASSFCSLPMVWRIVASSCWRALSCSWWMLAIKFRWRTLLYFIKKYKHPMVNSIKLIAPRVHPKVCLLYTSPSPRDRG